MNHSSKNKVLLYYPSFIKDNEKILYVDIPLSVVSLAARLCNKCQVEIIDGRITNNYNMPNLLKEVIVVGISATTSRQITNGLEFAKMVRQYNKDIKIIWGGWHPSLMPDETIRHELVDVVVIGQGEIVFEKLIKSISNKEEFTNIPNIIYKKNGEIIKTKSIVISDQIPKSMVPGYSCLDISSYIHPGWGRNRILGYESSRGCPFSCSFCSISAVYGQKWFGMSPDDIINDLTYLKNKCDIDAVHFFDNNFFVSKKRVFEFAQKIKQRNIQINWDGTVVVEQFIKFTQSEIDMLKESGFYRAIAGIESGDDEVLQNINKKHRNHQVLELVKICGYNGIMPSLSFVIGFPWNPEKDMKNTMDLIEKIKNTNPETEILLFIFSPYLGTPLYTIAKEYGMSFPDTLEGWSEFTYDKPNTPWLTNPMIRKMNRYLSFFGTKELSDSQNLFFNKFSGKV